MRLLSVLLVLPMVAKAITTQHCSDTQDESIKGAMADFQQHVDTTRQYLETHCYGTLRYKTWFGTSFTTDHKNTVFANFNNINKDVSTYVYDCSCNDFTLDAYFEPGKPTGIIKLCSAFWQKPSTGTESKAGALVRIATRLAQQGNGRIFQQDSEILALKNPDKAILSPYNYEYFAENTPTPP